MRLSYRWLGLSSLLAGCSVAAPGPDLHAPVSSPALQTAKPVQAEDIHQIVQRLTSRRAEDIEVTDHPGGVKVYQVKQGLGQVVVARTNSDGTVSTKCVDSAEDSRSFLGDEAAAAPQRGNQQ